MKKFFKKLKGLVNKKSLLEVAIESVKDKLDDLVLNGHDVDRKDLDDLERIIKKYIIKK